MKRNAAESADPLLVARWRKQREPRFSLGNAKLDPTLFLVHWLVGDNREPEFFRIEIQRASLVTHRNVDNFNVADHGKDFRLRPLRLSRQRRASVKKPLSV